MGSDDVDVDVDDDDDVDVDVDMDVRIVGGAADALNTGDALEMRVFCVGDGCGLCDGDGGMTGTGAMAPVNVPVLGRCGLSGGRGDAGVVVNAAMLGVMDGSDVGMAGRDASNAACS